MPLNAFLTIPLLTEKIMLALLPTASFWYAVWGCSTNFLCNSLSYLFSFPCVLSPPLLLIKLEGNLPVVFSSLTVMLPVIVNHLNPPDMQSYLHTAEVFTHVSVCRIRVNEDAIVTCKLSSLKFFLLFSMAVKCSEIPDQKKSR